MAKKMTCRQTAEIACKKWFAYQNSLELEIALRLVKDFEPKVVCEIGVAHGGSLAAWAEVTKADTVIAIDPLTIPRTPSQNESYKSLVKKYDIEVIPYISRLQECHDMLAKILDGRKIDFLFIDAGHGFDDVIHDFYKYLPYVNRPGIIGFHDISYNETLFDAGSQVNVLWERIKLKYPNYDEFQFNSTMGIGLLRLNKNDQ